MAVTVNGFTTAAIHTAAQSAGEGGEVLFPAGEYASDGLTVSYADQTWILARRAVIKRTDQSITSVITLGADGFRLRGGTLDGNRYNNSNNANGITSTGFSLDIEDCDIHSCKNYGISLSDGELLVDRCKIRKTGLDGIFWRITSGGVARQAPQVYRTVIDRASGSDYENGGGIAVICAANKKGRGLRVRDCSITVFNPGGNPNNSGGVGVFACDYVMVSGCEIVGGRMAVSLNDSDFSIITGNSFRGSSSYHVELVGCQYPAVGLNTIRGPGGHSRGIENNNSNHSRLMGNAIAGTGSDVRISRGCFGVVNRDN